MNGAKRLIVLLPLALRGRLLPLGWSDHVGTLATLVCGGRPEEMHCKDEMGPNEYITADAIRVWSDALLYR